MACGDFAEYASSATWPRVVTAGLALLGLKDTCMFTRWGDIVRAAWRFLCDAGGLQ